MLIFFFLGIILGLSQINDPIADYLGRIESVIYGRSDRRFYTNDQVYRFDVDLNQDGQMEALISSSLDKNGKQGNAFQVYKKTLQGFERAGEIYLYPDGFYLGEIDEINRYGIIKFWPSGGGEGGYSVYIFDGEKITEIPLGALIRNRETLEIEGKGLEIAAKYSLIVSDAIYDQVQRLRADPEYHEIDTSKFVSAAQSVNTEILAEKYKIPIDPRTYQQALTKEMNASSSPSESNLATVTPNTEPIVAPSRESQSTPTLDALSEPMKSKPSTVFWLWIIGTILLLAVAGRVIFKLRVR